MNINQIHGAQPFLRSYQSLGKTRNFPPFM